MRLLPLRRSRRARGLLTAAEVDRRILLAAAVATAPQDAAELARQSLDVPGGDDDAVVRAFGDYAAAQEDAAVAQQHLLQLLVDVEQRPLPTAAPLLGLAPDQAKDLLTEARRSSGTASLSGTCRGWGLVSRQRRLTPPEQDAAKGHLELCRRCRDRLAAQDRAQQALLARTSGVAALVGAVELVGLGSGGAAAAGGAGLLATKAAAGIAAAAVAVTVGGGVAAVAAHDEGPAPAATVVENPARPGELQPVTARETPAGVPPAEPAGVPAGPTTSPTAPASTAPLALPTTVPAAAPASPTALPAPGALLASPLPAVTGLVPSALPSALPALPQPLQSALPDVPAAAAPSLPPAPAALVPPLVGLPTGLR